VTGAKIDHINNTTSLVIQEKEKQKNLQEIENLKKQNRQTVRNLDRLNEKILEANNFI
jgi:hypothetical protein